MAAKPESGASAAPEAVPAAKEAGDGSAKPVEAQQRQIKQRKGQFLIAPRRRPGMQMMGLAPLQFSAVEQALRNSPDIEIIDRVGPKEGVSALGAGFQEAASGW